MQIEIDFSFNFVINEFDNNPQYRICRIIAEILNDCGYGEIRDENNICINTYAEPYVTGIVGEENHEFFIGYLFDINNNSDHGNIQQLLTQGIINIHEQISNQFPNIRIFIRTSYITI